MRGIAALGISLTQIKPRFHVFRIAGQRSAESRFRVRRDIALRRQRQCFAISRQHGRALCWCYERNGALVCGGGVLRIFKAQIFASQYEPALHIVGPLAHFPGQKRNQPALVGGFDV